MKEHENKDQERLLETIDVMMERGHATASVGELDDVVHLSLHEIAHVHIVAKANVDLWEKRADESKALLLAHWPDGTSVIDVPGVGGVAYTSPSSQRRVDEKALKLAFADYAKQLRAAGIVVSGEVPKRAVPVPASVKVVKEPKQAAAV